MTNAVAPEAEKAGLRRALGAPVRTIERGLRLLDRALAAAAGATLILITLVLVANALGRSLPAIRISGGPTLAGLLIIWLTFLGAFCAARAGGHIVIDVISRLLPAGAARGLRVLVGLLCAAICLDAARFGYDFAAARFASGQIDQMLFINAGWFYAAPPIGFGLCALAWLHDAVAAALGVAIGPAAERTEESA